MQNDKEKFSGESRDWFTEIFWGKNEYFSYRAWRSIDIIKLIQHNNAVSPFSF